MTTLIDPKALIDQWTARAAVATMSANDPAASCDVQARYAFAADATKRCIKDLTEEASSTPSIILTRATPQLHVVVNAPALDRRVAQITHVTSGRQVINSDDGYFYGSAYFEGDRTQLVLMRQQLEAIGYKVTLRE